MKFFNAIAAWLKRIKEKEQANKKERRAKELENFSCKAINVVEFNGRLYIAYKGMPIVRVDDLKQKVPETLSQSREDYLEWKTKFNEKRYGDI